MKSRKFSLRVHQRFCNRISKLIEPNRSSSVNVLVPSSTVQISSQSQLHAAKGSHKNINQHQLVRAPRPKASSREFLLLRLPKLRSASSSKLPAVVLASWCYRFSLLSVSGGKKLYFVAIALAFSEFFPKKDKARAKKTFVWATLVVRDQWNVPRLILNYHWTPISGRKPFK